LLALGIRLACILTELTRSKRRQLRVTRCCWWLRGGSDVTRRQGWRPTPVEVSIHDGIHLPRAEI